MKAFTLEERAELKSAKTISDILFVLSVHVSFFNYDLLERIITKFAPADEPLLREYLSKFKTFCERNVFEVPPSVYYRDCSSDSEEYFALKYACEGSVSLNKVKTVCLLIADILQIDSCNLRLAMIEDGCVLLKFFIPKEIAIDVLPITAEQETRLNAADLQRDLGDAYWSTMEKVNEQEQVMFTEEKYSTGEKEVKIDECEMQPMVNPSSDLDSFEKLLVSKNSEPERDRKLYDLYKSAVAERDIMTERLSIYHKNYKAEEEKFQQQAEENDAQLRLLQLAIGAYCNNFDEERKAKTAATTELESVKEMNDKLERENKMLKEKVEDLKDQVCANNGQITGELTAAGDASANCQKCSDLQKEKNYKAEEEKFQQQAEENDAQLRLLQLAIGTYCNNFDEERKAKTAATTELESVKEMNDELERENKILKEKVEDLKDQLGANNGQITGELTAAGDASANCQKCSDLQKEAQYLRGQLEHLKGEVEHIRMKLDMMRIRQKEKEAYAHELEQEVTQLEQEKDPHGSTHSESQLHHFKRNRQLEVPVLHPSHLPLTMFPAPSQPQQQIHLLKGLQKSDSGFNEEQIEHVPYSKDPASLLQPRKSPGHRPLYKNIDVPYRSEAQQLFRSNVSPNEDSGYGTLGVPKHNYYCPSPPEVPTRESRPFLPPPQPIGASRQYVQSPIGYDKASDHVKDQPGKGAHKIKPHTPSPNQHASPPQMDNPNAASASETSSGVDGRRPNEQLNTNCMREQRQTVVNERSAGDTEPFSPTVCSESAVKND